MDLRRTMATLWAFHVLGVLWCFVGGQKASDLERLFNDKILPCNPYIRPVFNQTDQLDITISVNIVAIIDFNEVQEKLSFTGWLDLKWRDELLSWNLDQYGGVLEIITPVDRIWRPNIAVANTMHTFSPLLDSTDLAMVHHDGQVEWSPGTNFQVYCEVDTTEFPFDSQECDVELLVWDYNMTTVDLSPGKNYVGTTAFRSNGEWSVITTSVFKEVRYPSKNPKPFVIAKIKVKRRPQFVLINIILPTALLTVLNCFVFLIPSDSGEKISFSVTILLAYGVLMSFITDRLPQTSKTTSSLSLYMISSLAVSSLFVCLAILTTRLYKKNEAESPVPEMIACLTKRTERVLCRRIYKKQAKQKYENSENGTNIDKNDILNGSTYIRYSGDTEIVQPMTWKRVSNALDLIMFLISFLSIATASFVLVGEDLIYKRDS